MGGGITAFIAAFGIGANDVANAYATSVGSKALTIKQACFLAVIFEFGGAVLAGSSVSDTIRKGIADHDCFSGGYMDSAILMYGNLVVVGAVAMWLLLASWAEMPVSTTHSCVGGLIGMTIVAKGGGCVVWVKHTDAENLYIPKGVVGIVLSWIISPVLSAFFAVILFTLVRSIILRSKNSFSRSIILYPILIMIAVWINAFFVISKGIAKKICTKGESSFICYSNGKVKGWVAMGFSCAVGAVVALVCLPIYPHISRTVKAQFAAKEAEAEAALEKASSDKKIEVTEEDKAGKAQDDDNPNPFEDPDATYGRQIGKAVWTALGTSLNVNPHAAIEEDPVVTAIHNNAEKFDPMTEAVFRYIQIFTAICDSFAHGANDVANAMGPFMAIYAIYNDGGVSKKVDMDNDAYWILAVGGVGVGLLLYGYKIMRAIGVKLAVITPSRGFAIELGAAIVIIIGSYLGLPLSTTHCQVGATTGVALLEGPKGVNYFVLMKTVIGWVITLIVVGFTTAALVAQGIFSPISGSPTDLGSIQGRFLSEECPEFIAPKYDFIQFSDCELSYCDGAGC